MRVKEQELWERVLRAHGKLEKARTARRMMERTRAGWDEMRSAESRVWKAERAFRKASETDATDYASSVIDGDIDSTITVEMSR